LLESKTRLSVVYLTLTEGSFCMRNFCFWLCFSVFIARTFFSAEPFRRLRTATSIFEKLLDQKTFIDLVPFFLCLNLTQKAPCRLVRRKHDAFFYL